jgi:hypothetical protein
VRTSPTVEGGENTRNDRSRFAKSLLRASLSPFTGFQGHFSPLTSSSLPRRCPILRPCSAKRVNPVKTGKPSKPFVGAD